MCKFEVYYMCPLDYLLLVVLIGLMSLEIFTGKTIIIELKPPVGQSYRQLVFSLAMPVRRISNSLYQCDGVDVGL